MMYSEYERIMNEQKAKERMSLIDMETNIKDALFHLKDALKDVKDIPIDDKTWELTHHMYSAVEDCDKALNIIFTKETIADNRNRSGVKFDPVTCMFHVDEEN